MIDSIENTCFNKCLANFLSSLLTVERRIRETLCTVYSRDTLERRFIVST